MSKVISAEVPDELADEIDAARTGEPPDYDESRSAAVKRLIRTGLDAEDNSALYVGILLGWVMFAGAFVEIDAILGYLGAALVLLLTLEAKYGLTERLR